MVLSEADSLLFAAKRIGTNRDGAPVSGIRWISAISVSQPSARTVLPTENRQASCFQMPGSAISAMAGEASKYPPAEPGALGCEPLKAAGYGR